MSQSGPGSDNNALTLDDFRGSANRRRNERKPIGRTVRVYSPEHKSQNAILCDCSPNGVCILLSKPLQADAQFMLKLKTDRLRMLAYTVRWWWKTAEGHFRIGAELSAVFGAPDEPDTEDIFRSVIQVASETR